MRILVASIYFPPRLGGIESHVFYLARGLARCGHEVEVVTMKTDPDAPPREEVEGVGVTRLWSPGPNLAGWLWGGAAMLGPALKRWRWADVIHAHTFQAAPAGAAAGLTGGKPLLTTVHSSHFLRLAARPTWRPILRALLAPARLLLGTSREICDVVRSLVPRVPCREVVNGVDVELFRRIEPKLRRGAGERVLLAARRLMPKNGVEYLVRAMPYIKQEVPVRLYIVGDGALRQELTELSRDLGVGEVVTFLGGIPNKEMPAYYSSADVVVMPSLVEATSVTALEAMACECPVAASRVGGLPEIVSEETGTLFAPGDPADMAEKVIALLRANDAPERGRRGRELVVRHWSLDRLVEDHETMFRLLRTGLRGEHLARALEGAV